MGRVSSGKNSFQEYRTPEALMEQIAKHFRIVFDLAAHEGNHKAAQWFGPGGDLEDAFEASWVDMTPNLNEWLWLNPPYKNIGPWYLQCQRDSARGARILSLVPMDAAGWFDYVPGHAGIWHLKGRIKFDGAKDSNTKDSALHIWAPEFVGQFKVWDWKNDLFLI